jgi:molecular chaperone DnaK (HSP70)
MKNNIISIDFCVDKVIAIDLVSDYTINELKIIDNCNGYKDLSEENIEGIFSELYENTGEVEAVCAIPAYFNVLQCKMINDIAKRFGISIKRLINKTTAVALGYEYYLKQRQNKYEDKTIAVCSFDNGFLEIAFVDIGDGVIEILSVDWDNTFDKENIDIDKFNYLWNKIITEYNQRLTADKRMIKINNIDHVLLSCNNKYLPVLQPMVFELFKSYPVDFINNEYMSAYGASIQGGILCGDIKESLLLDVITMSLGIGTTDGSMRKLIQNNTTIPTRKSLLLSSNKDLKYAKNIFVFQGENNISVQNHFLGSINIENLFPVSTNDIPIEITIDVDANCMICVTVKNLENGNGCKLRI